MNFWQTIHLGLLRTSWSNPAVYLGWKKAFFLELKQSSLNVSFNLCSIVKFRRRAKIFKFRVVLLAFSLFLFCQLCLYVSDSLHLFTLFLMDSFEKCQTKSFKNEYSTFCNYFIIDEIPNDLIPAANLGKHRCIISTSTKCYG